MKEEQKVPLGAGRGIVFCRIGWRAEFCAKLPGEEHDHQQHRQTGHGIFKHLVGPEVLAEALATSAQFGRDAVSTKQRQVDHQQADQQGRQHTCMDGKEPSEGLGSVIGTPDSDFR